MMETIVKVAVLPVVLKAVAVLLMIRFVSFDWVGGVVEMLAEVLGRVDVVIVVWPGIDQVQEFMTDFSLLKFPM